MQLSRAEDRQNHALVEVAPTAVDSHALADQGPTVVLADETLGVALPRALKEGSEIAIVRLSLDQGFPTRSFRLREAAVQAVRE